MRNSEDRVRFLTWLGLSYYEARAYLALLDSGEARASALAGASGVPRGRIYDVIERLHKRGLLEILPVKPRLFRAAPPTSFLEARKRELHTQQTEIDRQAELLVSSIRAGKPRPWEPPREFLMYQVGKAVTARILDMVAGLKRELTVACSNPSVLWSQKDLLHLLWQKVSEGVAVKVMTKVTQVDAQSLAPLQSLAEVRDAKFVGPPFAILVADGEQVLCCSWTEQESLPGRMADKALWSNDPAFAGALQSLLRCTWRAGRVRTSKRTGRNR